MATQTSTKREAAKQKLITNIFKNKYRPGEKLASSSELAKQFGISEGTVHLALNDLQREKIVQRVHGSGTYISNNNGAININVPIIDPEKNLEKHFWGKILEMADKTPRKIELKRVLHKPSSLDFNQQRQVVEMFTMPEAVGLFKIHVDDLNWLIHAGFCEDLSSLYSAWTQKDNVYQVALDAVTHNGKIYGLPFHSTLSGIVYQKRIFEYHGINTEQVFFSVDDFIRAMEVFSRSDDFQYTFWTGSTRLFLMYLLRAYYDDLLVRFSPNKEEAVDREIGIEVLQIIKRMKWKLNAFLPMPADNHWKPLIKSFAGEKIPMGICHLLPKRWYELSSGENADGIDISPVCFSQDKKPVSLFSCSVWIINPGLGSETKDFLRFFLSEYVDPRSQYELDRKHLENDSLNARCTVFKRVPKRIPADHVFEEKHKQLFSCAEQMLPFPSPVFDKFMTAVYRIITDPGAIPEKEYDFYRQMLNETPPTLHFGNAM